MARPPAWIDVTASDASRSRAFYAGLSGWPISVVEEIDYGLVAPGEERLPGGIRQGEADRHSVGTVTHFTVDDVPTAVDRAAALGATTAVEPWDVPEAGTLAVVRDPDGTRVGPRSPAP